MQSSGTNKKRRVFNKKQKLRYYVYICRGEADPYLKTLLEPHLESSAASRNLNGVFHFKAVK